MWIRLGNGRVVLTHHEAHIQRLLNEGGIEVPDPTLAREATSDASTLNNDRPDSTGQNDDSGPKRRKPAVQRSGKRPPK